MEVKAWSAFIPQTKAQFGAPFLSTPLPRPAIIAETLAEGEKSSQPERDRLQGWQPRDNKGHLAYLPYSTLRRISSCCSGSCDGRARARALLLLLLLFLLINWFLWLCPPPPHYSHTVRQQQGFSIQFMATRKPPTVSWRGSGRGRAVIGLKWSAVSAVCANSQNPDFDVHYDTLSSGVSTFRLSCYCALSSRTICVTKRALSISFCQKVVNTVDQEIPRV